MVGRIEAVATIARTDEVMVSAGTTVKYVLWPMGAEAVTVSPRFFWS